MAVSVGADVVVALGWGVDVPVGTGVSVLTAVGGAVELGTGVAVSVGAAVGVSLGAILITVVDYRVLIVVMGLVTGLVGILLAVAGAPPEPVGLKRESR